LWDGCVWILPCGKSRHFKAHAHRARSLSRVRLIAFQLLVLLACCFLQAMLARTQNQEAKLPPPGFHHLHLNSTNPYAAIEFYTKQFPSTAKSSFGGIPALKAGKVYVLFTKVNAPPPTEPQKAIWNFGWCWMCARISKPTCRATSRFCRSSPRTTAPRSDYLARFRSSVRPH